MNGISITCYVLYAGMKVHVSYVAEKLITCVSATFIAPLDSNYLTLHPLGTKLWFWYNKHLLWLNILLYDPLWVFQSSLPQMCYNFLQIAFLTLAMLILATDKTKSDQSEAKQFVCKRELCTSLALKQSCYLSVEYSE